MPGAASGHELFKAMDFVEDGGAHRMFVAYNAGLQAWTLDTDPESPGLLTFRDGWRDQFLSFPPVSEQLTFVEDVAAMNLGPGRDLVVASGKPPVGPTIWTFDVATRDLNPVYQDTRTEARLVRLEQMADGTIYLFAGSDDGVAIYNASAALALPSDCLEEQGSVCPTVYRGLIPTIQLGHYVDTVRNPVTDRVYVATADGNFVAPQIWELADPNDPGSAVLRFEAPNMKKARGPALFAYDGHYYWAVEELDELKIFIVDDCVAGNDCELAPGSVELAADPIPLRDNPATIEYLTFSEGDDGIPYLYYGVSAGFLKGEDIEQLFDVSALRPPDGGPRPTMVELTAGGGAYTDPCTGETIRYWSHYYPRNTHGLRNFVPRMARVGPGNHLYRGANAVLDVHVLLRSPALTVQAVTAAPHAIDQEILFAARGHDGCAGNLGRWSWSADAPAEVAVELISAQDAQATFAFHCERASERCPDAEVTVSATNDAASCVGATVTPATITVLDTRVVGASDSGGGTGGTRGSESAGGTGGAGAGSGGASGGSAASGPGSGAALTDGGETAGTGGVPGSGFASGRGVHSGEGCGCRSNPRGLRWGWVFAAPLLRRRRRRRLANRPGA